MPRVAVNNKKYRINDLEDYIRGEMKRQKISQSAMADRTGMSQQTFSARLKKMDFNVSTMMDIFSALGTDQEKIGRMMKV